MSKKNDWKSQLDQYNQLSLNNAKDLYREYMNTGDNGKRDLLIMGTLYIASKSGKETSKVLGPNYNVQDVIDLTIEYYIKEVYKGRLLEVKTFAELFGKEYVEFLKKNLTTSSIDLVPFTEDMAIGDISEPIITTLDENREEEYKEEVMKSLGAKGFTSVTVLAVAAASVSIGILLLGMYLTM